MNKAAAPEEKALSVPVDLPAVLQARDRRAAIRRNLLAEPGCCLLSLSLLMPGSIKTSTLSRAFLREYRFYLRNQLRGREFVITRELALPDPAGDVYFFLFSWDTDPVCLKKFAIILEEEFDWCRVLDLDLYLPEDKLLSRAGLQLAQRRCLLCEDEAYACGRSQGHPVADLQRKVRHYLRSGLHRLLPERMQAAALSAAISELLVAPKPGLVTGADAGSHTDMDRFTYANSIGSLAGYFRTAAECGLQAGLSRDPDSEPVSAENLTGEFLEILSRVHKEGLRAERLMFAASGGVNTQKGFIYLSGLLLAAAASIVGDPISFRASFAAESEQDYVECLQREVSRWALALEKVQASSFEARETAGDSIRRLYGISGVRGEAAGGMKSVFQLALPFYRGLRERAMAKNEAAAVTLLLLLAAAEDTTLIKRAGLQEALRIRQELAAFFHKMSRPGGRCPTRLENNLLADNKSADGTDQLAADALSSLCLDNIAGQETAVIAYISLWSDYFRENNYSAGGAADLLAISLLVLKLLADI